MILRQARLLPSEYKCMSFSRAMADSRSPDGVCDAYVGGVHAVAVGGNYTDMRLGAPYFSSWLMSAYSGDDSATLYGGWGAFTRPFAWGVWLGIFAIVMIIPLVSAVVEIDPGETVVTNYAMYLPDAWHAITGVDTLKRSEDVSELTAWLSVIMAIASIIVVSMYSCNLASFVLYATLRPEDVVTAPPDGATVHGPWWAEKSALENSRGVTFVEEYPASKITIDAVRSGGMVYVADELSALFVGGCSARRSRVGAVNLFYSPGFPTGHATGFNVTDVDHISTWMSVHANVLENTIKEFKAVYAGECSVTPQPVGVNNMIGLFVLYGSVVFGVTVASFAFPFVRDKVFPRVKWGFYGVVDLVRLFFARVELPCTAVICTE